jgi:DNA polymerase III epsilon subunit-like protein
MKAFILDTETTGLIRNHTIALDKQPEIIEFYGALVDLETGDLLKEIASFIRPANFPRSDEVKKDTKTQISDEELENAPLFRDVADQIKEAIETWAPIAIAHNMSYDQEMINIEFERLGKQVKWPRLLCSVEQSLHIKGHRLTLTDLYMFLFNEGFKDAHRAKADTQALIRSCVELYKRKML